MVWNHVPGLEHDLAAAVESECLAAAAAVAAVAAVAVYADVDIGCWSVVGSLPVAGSAAEAM